MMQEACVRYRFIVNPVAGMWEGERSLPVLRRRLKELGVDYDLITTEYAGHGIALARSAAEEGCDVIVAVGGDGTANEVLNGLLQVRESGRSIPAMGVLCVGSGNDFAFGAGVPRGLEEGIRMLMGGQERRIDVGRVQVDGRSEGRFFGNGVGIGFDAVVGFEAQKMKSLHGFLCYLVAALKTLFIYFRPPTVRIEMNETTHVQAALMVSVMNGRRMGGGFLMAPSALPDDGSFDICIAGKVSRLRVLLLIGRFMKGSQEGHPAIRMERTQRLTVVAEQGSLPAHADGETLCEEGRRLDIEIVPDALTVLAAPQPEDL